MSGGTAAHFNYRRDTLAGQVGGDNEIRDPAGYIDRL
jgi:hypothetical protein